jgi:hypothetical protein
VIRLFVDFGDLVSAYRGGKAAAWELCEMSNSAVRRCLGWTLEIPVLLGVRVQLLFFLFFSSAAYGYYVRQDIVTALRDIWISFCDHASKRISV